MHIQTFEVCKFQGFCSQLVIYKIFTLELLLAKLLLALIREQYTLERRRLTLARDDGKLLP